MFFITTANTEFLQDETILLLAIWHQLIANNFGLHFLVNLLSINITCCKSTLKIIGQDKNITKFSSEIANYIFSWQKVGCSDKAKWLGILLREDVCGLVL